MSDARLSMLDRVLDFYRAHGVRDHSVRTVARGIGSSQRMLHYHFGSRDQVVQAAADHLLDQLRSGGVAWATGSSDGAGVDSVSTLVEWLEAIWAAGCRRVDQDGALLVELSSHAIRELPSGTGLGRLRSKLSAAIRHRLSLAVPSTDAAAVADLIAASMTGLWLDLAAGMEPGRADRAFGVLVETVGNLAPPVD